MDIKMKILLWSIIASGFASSCKKETYTDTNVSDFEVCWKGIDRDYVFMDYKNINWDSIYYAYLPKAQAAVGDEIELILINLLRELHDGHVKLITPGGYTLRPYLPRRIAKDIDSYSIEVIRNYFDKELKLAAGNIIEYEYLPNNIGYMHLVEMAYYDNYGKIAEFDKVLEYFESTDKLIIDLRDNVGGWSGNVVKRFIQQPLVLNEIYKDRVQKLTISPHYKNYSFQIVAIINGCILSAGEYFAYFLKEAYPNAVVIGDTTSGMSGSIGNINDIIQLPSGRSVQHCVCYHSFDSSTFEDSGVIPDILVPQTKKDISAGKDLQLEYAIKLLETNN